MTENLPPSVLPDSTSPSPSAAAPPDSTSPDQVDESSSLSPSLPESPSLDPNLESLNLDNEQLDRIERKLLLDERRARLSIKTVDLEHYNQNAALLRRSSLIQHLTQGVVGIVLLGTGIGLTAFDQALGPYMMGVGAATASFGLKESIQLQRPFVKQDESA